MTRYAMCLRAFPRAWRDRYGAELLGVLAERGDGHVWHERAGLVRAGLAERTRGPWPAVPRAVWVAVPAALAAIAVGPAALAPGTATPPAVGVASVTAIAVLHQVPGHGASGPVRARLPAGERPHSRIRPRLAVRTTTARTVIIRPAAALGRPAVRGRRI